MKKKDFLSLLNMNSPSASALVLTHVQDMELPKGMLHLD